MIAAREFKTAAELEAHYRALKRKVWARPPVQEPITPVVFAPPPPAKKILPPPPKPKPRVDTMTRADRFRLILRTVADRCGVNPKDILALYRTAPIMLARRRAVSAVALAMPHLSLPQVAKMFNIDHTSALHAMKKYGVHERWKQRREPFKV